MDLLIKILNKNLLWLLTLNKPLWLVGCNMLPDWLPLI